MNWNRPALRGAAALGIAACCLLFGACRDESAKTPPTPQPARRSAEPKSNAKRPHVILISLCSVRADHLSCYGYPRATTPAIDALARDAVLFENAVTPWPKTAPSFCAVMTGLEPHQTGIMRTTPNQRLGDDFPTLAERFQSAGYHTAAFISSPALSVMLNLTQGFDVYQETFKMIDPWETTRKHGIEWLKAKHARPCLLWVHFNNAHYPYHPAGKFKKLFVDDAHYDASVTLPIHGQDQAIDLPADHPAPEPVRRADLGGIHRLAFLPERPTQRDYYVSQYDACLRGADEQIGLVIDGVRQSLGDEPFVIALWSDHGESLGEHNYYFEHGRFAYETCSHVPLILYDSARRPGGRRVDQPVSTVDLAATLAALTGVSGDGLAGVPLLDVIDGKAQRGDVFFSGGYHPDFITGIRRGPLKLMDIPNALDRKMMRGRPVELYHITDDPMERHDLADAQGAMVKSLTAALETWKSPWWAKAVAQRVGKPMKYDRTTNKQLNSIGYVTGDNGNQPASSQAGAGAPASRPVGSGG